MDFLQRHRRIAITSISFAFALAALWYVLRAFDWTAFVAAVRNLDPRWVAAAVLMDVLSYVCQGERWRRLLCSVTPVSLLSTTRAIYAGLFVNEVMPMRPGEVLRGLILARDCGRPPTALIPSMVAERLMDGAVLIAAALWTAVYVPLPDPVSGYLRAGAVVAIVLAALWMLAGHKVPTSWREPLHNWSALRVSILLFLIQCLAVWFALRACSLPISLPAGCAITAVLRVGTALPMAPANVGTHQLALIFGLSLFGISRAQATPVAFIVFAVLTLPLLTLGSLAAASSGRAQLWQLAATRAEHP